MKRALLLVLTLTTATLSACGGGDDTPTPMASMASTASTAQFPQNVEAFYTGASYPDLAARLSVPIGTMKSWVRRSLLQLKTCLEQQP